MSERAAALTRTSVPTITAVLTALIALSALIGWSFEVAALRSVVPGSDAVKANTAAGLLLSALALVLLGNPARRIPVYTGQAIAVGVALLGFATLGEYAFHWNLGIDDLAFDNGSPLYAEAFGRMPAYTAVGFTGIGVALACLPWPRLRSCVMAVAGTLLVTAAVAVIGYLCGAAEIITDRWAPPVAVHTALAFVLLGTGTLVASVRRVYGPAAQARRASIVERGVLAGFSATVLIMFVTAAFTYGAGADLRSRVLMLISLGLTIAVAAGMLALFRAVRRAIAARTASEHALVEANTFLDSIVENIPDMVFVKDADKLKFVRFNRAGEILLERDRAALLGRSDYDLFPQEMADRFTAKDREVLASDATHDIAQEKLQTPSRGERILHTKKIPIRDAYGRARYLLGISEDITDQARSEDEIRVLNAALAQRADQLEALNRELETFSYSVSHDLRAPLRHISGYVQLLTKAIEGDLAPEPRRYLEVISQASRQMAALIDDLLSFSQMSRADLHDACVAPRDAVDAVIADLDMGGRGRTIEWRISDMPMVHADPALLKVVYTNLIGNAVKYSAPRERALIEIGAEGEEAERTVLFVRDNGVGFDMAYADRLFGIFQRLHRADEFEGTGIGLATVQRIVARHGGRVWAQAAPDQGATFYFTLRTADVDRSP